ncbi:uncharacterized protein [Amphiura filiformis]|uniref:uncharacterized protein n=1 Tax=Amphiura filiformis TaxID=82378 RepID=UPI003B2100E5
MMYVGLILTSLKDHPIYSRKEFPNCLPLQNLGKQLSENADHPAFKNFWTETAMELWKIITSADKRVLSCQSYDVIFANFHNFRLGNIKKNWDNLLKELNITNIHELLSNILLQFCLRNLNRKIIKDRNIADLQENNDVNSTPLTPHDHQVINYISGFIPFALVKRFSKVKTTMAAKFVRVLKSWRLNNSNDEHESFVTYARDWVKKQNRGYLFQPNWDLHVFF